MKKSTKSYYRPNQKWVCGRSREGKACSEGPSSSGNCHLKWECKPSEKGDGFVCSRPPQFGGKCSDGPLPDGACSHKVPPCTPERSIRSLRFVYTLAFFSICVAIVFVLIGIPDSQQFIVSAGPLSSHHRTMKNNCASCHSNAHGTVIDWVKNRPTKIENSQACIKCHKIVKHPFNPHNLPTDRLKKLTAGKSLDEKSGAPKEWGCSSCHKEHKGDNDFLATMSDKDCQSCHTQKFESFENGHPEFSNFPFVRSQKINFDHSEHLRKHFPDLKKSGSCINCHSIEVTGRAIMRDGFKKQCMSCHGAELVGEMSSATGIPFINIPGLDLDVLKKKGFKVGDWPSEAHNEMSEFTKLLIFSNKEFGLLYRKVRALDLTDLDGVSQKKLQLVEDFVWGFKEMLYDILEEDSGQFKQRIGFIFNRKFFDQEASALMAGFPIDVLRKAIVEWIPSLFIEMSMKEQGHQYPTRGIKFKKEYNEDEGWMNLGGWYRSDEDYSIKYRTSGHEDKFINAWLDLTGRKYSHFREVKGVFDQLANHKSAGKCTKCHTVQKNNLENLTINWQANGVRKIEKSLVKFNHKSHVGMMKDKGCLACHNLEKRAAFMPVDSLTHSPDRVRGNFGNINKSTCLECHSKDKVKNGCMTCHTYHIDGADMIENSLKDLKTY